MTLHFFNYYFITFQPGIHFSEVTKRFILLILPTPHLPHFPLPT